MKTYLSFVISLFSVLAASCTPVSTPGAMSTNTPTDLPKPTETIAPPALEAVLVIEGDATPLNLPSGVAVDGQGNIYVMDGGNSRIVKFDPMGQPLTAWGDEGDGDGQFHITDDRPGRLAADEEGNVYVADDGNSRIQKFNENGKFLAQWDLQSMGGSQFQHPFDITLDTEGNVYVSD